jgi:hypothetical protein
MRVRKTHNELRCFCARHPLLATFGVDEKGELYVHIKIFKQQRIFGEVIVMKGDVKLRCRECLRWHRVVMRLPNEVSLVEEVSNPSTSEVSSTP